MPRNYEQKTVKSYTDKTLAKCINAFENGKMSFCKASKYFQVCFVKFFLHLAYGRNRVETKVHHSKPSVSAMFAGSADGTYLPSLVVYKSKTFILNGCTGVLTTLFIHAQRVGGSTQQCLKL